MNQYEHVHPDFRHILLLSNTERIAFLESPRWIDYPIAKKIHDTLHGLLNKPKRPRMPNLLLVGDSNNGKTTIIRRFFDIYGQGHVNDNSEPVKPIIIAESPPTADEKGLYLSILKRFFAPSRPSDSTSKLRYQVIHLMSSCHVNMLIIDEFHSMLTGSAIKQREVMNAIKLLCNELAIPIVGVGTKEAVRILHTDPQHASRFDVITLPSWQLNKDFQQLLSGFEQILPLKKPSFLYMPESATLIHTISEGNMGNVHKLLVRCTVDAINNGAESIDKEIIKNNNWIHPTRGIREFMM